MYFLFVDTNNVAARLFKQFASFCVLKNIGNSTDEGFIIVAHNPSRFEKAFSSSCGLKTCELYFRFYHLRFP